MGWGLVGRGFWGGGFLELGGISIGLRIFGEFGICDDVFFMDN